MAKNILRKYVEDMFPTANGQDIRTIMELLVIAADAEASVREGSK